jgi:basic membrane protein A and related proteins
MVHKQTSTKLKFFHGGKKMKKKVLSLLLAATMVFGLTACGDAKPDKDSNNNSGKYELALITDVGTIDDKSFNQGSWEGLLKYAEEKKLTYKYYKPAEKSDQACLDAIALAVKGGAKVIVVPGFLFTNPIGIAQDKYPEVKFVFIDGAPEVDKKIVVGKNVHSIFFAEEQAGYLAGYAAVKDGYKKLGFMGGIAVPAVVRFGYGFVQGADAAAKEMKITDAAINYTYVGNFDASPENQAIAASWFSEGTEVIFGCGGGVGNSVMKAAEAKGAKVIGVDVDQSAESKTVITSAMKNLGKAVYDTIATVYDDKFEGGVMVTLDASVEGIQLPMDTSIFKTFKQADYDALFAKLVDGSVKVQKDDAVASADKLTVEAIKVNVVK